jgi:LAO/AO transport system kinase
MVRVSATRGPGFSAEAIAAGDRQALAKAITLVESSRLDDRAQALDVLEELRPRTGESTRIGVSGPPGVGKSTFIEALGLHVIEQGHQVAVLAVDPSSVVSGGSILGDKIRMEGLSRKEDAFIRPSPTRRTSGGVARRTHEVMLLCEAAGFDVVMVETVGVGQSETMVADMTDVLVMLLQPGGGDELQGIKRGLLELAAFVVVNKADGELKAVAEQTALDYGAARAIRTEAEMAELLPVRTCSALTGEGVADVWSALEEYCRGQRESGALRARRSQQYRTWLWNEMAEDLVEELRGDPVVRARLPEVEQAVMSGETLPMIAARHLVDEFLGREGDR